MRAPDEARSRMARIYDSRRSRSWKQRLQQWLRPPDPFIMNPAEPRHAPLGRWNLYIGGAGGNPEGYVNIDLIPTPGVDVVADAEQLPFPEAIFRTIECDAVLEHVRNPEFVMREITRVLEEGGMVHIVTPFCHPFHEYPKDFRRFTIDGLREIANGLHVVSSGWRTGPTATMLVFALEYVKLWFPWRWWRIVSHGVLGWILFPLRYLDILLLRSSESSRIGNHCYIWLQKRTR